MHGDQHRAVQLHNKRTHNDRDGGSFLSQIPAEAASRQTASKRLSKLNKLVLQSRGHIELPRLHSLRSTKIIDSRDVTFPQCINRRPLWTSLRKIELLHSVGRTFLPNFLHRGRVPHLKKLVFRDRYGIPGTDYQHIMNKLRDKCPKPTYLKPTIKKPQRTTRQAPLLGLQGLQNLHTLCTDMDSLLDGSRHGERLDSGELLPPELARLDVFHLNFALIDSIMTQGKE